MAFTSRLRRSAAVPVVAGLVLAAACSAGETTASPGVTSAPCPGSVHKDRGCIYLGVLSDLANGPFTALGASMNEGQLAFWKQVNQAGGIGGYDIDITTKAEAPSLIPLAFPAVTVPSLVNAGRSLAIPSMLESWRIYSSSDTTVSPRRPFTVTAAISSRNRPAFCAADALVWLANANSSCSSRVIWYARATFSAVLPMW